jgi:hypothetical protein
MDKPAKERRKKLGAVRAKQDEILTERTLKARRDIGRFAGVAAPRQDYVVMLWLGLPSPFNKVLGRNTTDIGEV